MDSYKEARLEVSRTFKMEPDGVAVEGSFLMGAQFKSKVRFEQMDAEYNTLGIRSRLFFHSLIIAAALVVVAVVVGYFRGVRLDDFWFLLAATLPISSIVPAVMTYKRTEYALFKNKDGIVILDIGKTGPDKQYFEKFVNHIQENILRINES